MMASASTIPVDDLFDHHGVPLVSVPTAPMLSFPELVAALYDAAGTFQEKELTTAAGVRRAVAFILLYEGLGNLDRYAGELEQEESNGTLNAEELAWLRFCRERVQAVFQPGTGEHHPATYAAAGVA